MHGGYRSIVGPGGGGAAKRANVKAGQHWKVLGFFSVVGAWGWGCACDLHG